MNNADVWKYLHDGRIANVTGSVPGDVRVEVSIRYLRQRFPGSGTGFVLGLSNCTLLRYEPYEGAPVRSLGEIARREIEILSLESSEPIVVNCVMGTLHLAYTSSTLALDSGEPVSVKELSDASAGYWDEWSKRTRGSA